MKKDMFKLSQRNGLICKLLSIRSNIKLQRRKSIEHYLLLASCIAMPAIIILLLRYGLGADSILSNRDNNVISEDHAFQALQHSKYGNNYHQKLEATKDKFRKELNPFEEVSKTESYKKLLKTMEKRINKNEPEKRKSKKIKSKKRKSRNRTKANNSPDDRQKRDEQSNSKILSPKKNEGIKNLTESMDIYSGLQLSINKIKFNYVHNPEKGWSMTISGASSDVKKPAEEDINAMKIVGRVYELLINHCLDLIRFVPRGTEISLNTSSMANFPSEMFDFKNHRLKFEILPEVPTLTALYELIMALEDILDKIQLLQTPLAWKMSKDITKAINPRIAELILYKYSIIIAIVLSAFFHNLIVRPLLHYAFAVDKFVDLRTEDIYYLSTAEINCFLDSYRAQMDKLNKLVKVRQIYTNSIRTLLLTITFSAYASGKSRVIITSILAPYLLGTLIAATYDLARSKILERQFNHRTNTQIMQLKSCFPNYHVQVYPGNHTEINTVFSMEKSEKISSSREDLLFIRFILLKHNAKVHSLQYGRKTMLISIPTKFNAVEAKKSYNELIAAKVTADKAKIQFGKIKKYFPITYYDENIIYDKFNTPLYQFTVRKWHNSDYETALIDAGFIKFGGALVFSSATPLSPSKFSALSNKLQSAQYHIKEAESPPASKDKHQDKTRPTKHSSNKIPKPMETTKTNSSKDREPSQETYTWDIEGETIDSKDPRVSKLSGLNYEAYVFFRMEESLNEELYEAFKAKSQTMCRKKNSQGLRIYNEDDQQRVMPDGSVGRVKLLGAKGDISLSVFRAIPSGNKTNTRPLFYTDRNLIYHIH